MSRDGKRWVRDGVIAQMVGYKTHNVGRPTHYSQLLKRESRKALRAESRKLCRELA